MLPGKTGSEMENYVKRVRQMYVGKPGRTHARNPTKGLYDDSNIQGFSEVVTTPASYPDFLNTGRVQALIGEGLQLLGEIFPSGREGRESEYNDIIVNMQDELLRYLWSYSNTTHETAHAGPGPGPDPGWSGPDITGPQPAVPVKLQSVWSDNYNGQDLGSR